ncbi:hypothetical protein B7494_g8483, partial [Chlorociboria aeruginascens]
TLHIRPAHKPPPLPASAAILPLCTHRGHRDSIGCAPPQSLPSAPSLLAGTICSRGSPSYPPPTYLDLPSCLFLLDLPSTSLVLPHPPPSADVVCVTGIFDPRSRTPPLLAVPSIPARILRTTMSSHQRSSRGQQAQAAQNRTNEYFVPKEGIDREVITADICRYLGNDALVRPGIYENPQTRERQEGYFITAYRNLTTAMISDLKQDSARWDAERRQTQRGNQQSGIFSQDSNGLVRISNTPIVGYTHSSTHQSRQYYGPTEQSAPPAVPGYAQSAASTASSHTMQSSPYGDESSPYPQSYAQPSSAGYASTPGGYSQGDYISGAAYEVDAGRPDSGRIPTSQPGAVPRSGAMYASQFPYQGTDRSAPQYYPAQTSQPMSSTAYVQPPQQQQQPQPDPYYGRAPASGIYDSSQVIYDNRSGYPESVYTSQSPIPTSTTPTATASNQPRRDRERNDRDADRDRHHRRRG